MKPKLYIFAISHFCEKARWALDYLHIDHEIVHVAPLLHLSLARKLGARSSSLPILDTGEGVIQNSADIIDWADEATQSGRQLSPESQREECLQIEKRLDEVAGVHVRRMFYSEALVEHPATVRPLFTAELPFSQRLLIRGVWPLIRRRMIAALDLGLQQGKESTLIVEEQLQWLDALLADDKPFLVGNQLSRADIAAASLLSPLLAPDEHPSYQSLSLPPRLALQIQEWRNRRSLGWVRELYRKYR